MEVLDVIPISQVQEKTYVTAGRTGKHSAAPTVSAFRGHNCIFLFNLVRPVAGDLKVMLHGTIHNDDF